MVDIITHSLKRFVEDFVKDTPEYKRILKATPWGAELMLEHAILKVREWLSQVKWEQIENTRDINKNASKMGDGRIIGYIPEVFLKILEYKMGHAPTGNEIMKFLKEHPEFRTVDKI